MTDPEKMIFFPSGSVSSNNVPIIILKTGEFKDQKREYIIGTTLEDFQKYGIRGGRFYSKRRAIAYSEEAWERCSEIIGRLEELEKELDQLFKKEKRKRRK